MRALHGPSLVAVSTLGLLAAGAAAQQTLTVGAGQPFATIAAAIAAASAGDTILVQPGTYAGFTVGKGVRIVGRGALITGGGVFGTVRVQGVPAGETFALVGFGVTASGTCEVLDCRGQVALRDLDQSGGFQWSLLTRNSDEVHVAGSVFVSAALTDSNVVLERCVADPRVLSGIQLTRGLLILDSCTSRGSLGFAPGPGVLLNDGILVATRTTLRGTGGNAAIAAGAGQILLDPSVTLTTDPGTAPISGPVVPATFGFASQTAGTDGAQLSIQSHGLAGGTFAMLLGLPAPQTPLPSGFSWLEPSTSLLLYVGVWAQDRTHTLSIPHPPLQPGLTATLQSLYFQPAGLALGTPSLVTVP